MALNWNTVVENLNELLTNSVNLTNKYYDLFINPEPMMVTLELMDEDNTIQEVVVPNRAKDMELYQDAFDVIQSLAPVAISGDYNDLAHRPTIPTVYDGTVTVTQNEETIALFSMNQRGDSTIEITTPTKTSDLENDSGFITEVNVPTHALKGYLDSGERLEDTEGYADVSSYACSNFESSQFNYTNATVTINSSGIASNFSSNYFLRFRNTIPYQKNLAIRGEFQGGTPGVVFSIYSSASDTHKIVFWVEEVIGETTSYLVHLNSGVVNPAETFEAIGVTWPSSEVYFNISIEGELYLSADKVNWIRTGISSTIYYNDSTNPYFEIGGYYNNSGYTSFQGNIDLKEWIVGAPTNLSPLITDTLIVAAGNRVSSYKPEILLEGQQIEIPYLEGKTGAKVFPIFSTVSYIPPQVSSATLDILRSQQGYAPFYTIGIKEDINARAHGVYTLPIGELYGLINKIVDRKFDRNIGEIVVSSVPLSDASLHILDGSVLNGNGIYQDFYTFMVGASQDPNMSDCFCTQGEYNNSVTNYGMCGKFVVNTTLGTIQLPTYGKYLSVSTDVSTHTKATVTEASSVLTADLSEATDPISGYYYVVVANAKKTVVEVNIDNISSDLINKVDKGSLVNCHVVVDTYTNLSTGYWYRLYSDGWIEQGGQVPSSSFSSGICTVDMPLGYGNSNYIVEVSGSLASPASSTSNTNFPVLMTDTLQSSSFRILGRTIGDTSFSGFTVNWRTCGYKS